VRAAFSKAGGNLGETNSVAFMFERKGVVRYPGSVGSPDQVFEIALDAGADNVDSGAEGHEITCMPEDFAALRDALEKKFGAASSAKLQWRPLNSVLVDGAAAESLVRLVEALEDNDDVQTVSSNFDLSEETLARLTA
jgi:transcriptional/translational regulatory protein YebC/TACO1